MPYTHKIVPMTLAVIFIICLGLFLYQVPFSSQQSSQDTLTVGLQSGAPPFEFVESNGKCAGFDVDLAHLIAQKMGKKVVIRDMEFEGLIIALNQGKIDLIISAMNITPSRSKEIFMIPYHGEATDHFTLIFWNKIPDNVHTIEDLAKIPDASICAEVGSVHEEYINRYNKIIRVKSFPGILNALIDVKYGKSLALLVEPDIAGYLKKKHAEIKTLPITLPPDVAVEGLGIGVSKKNKSLYDEVSHIIQELKKSGELQNIEDQWFGGVKE